MAAFDILLVVSVCYIALGVINTARAIKGLVEKTLRISGGDRISPARLLIWKCPLFKAFAIWPLDVIVIVKEACRHDDHNES